MHFYKLFSSAPRRFSAVVPAGLTNKLAYPDDLQRLPRIYLSRQPGFRAIAEKTIKSLMLELGYALIQHLDTITLPVADKSAQQMTIVDYGLARSIYTWRYAQTTIPPEYNQLPDVLRMPERWCMMLFVIALFDGIARLLQQVTIYFPDGATWNPYNTSLREALKSQRSSYYRIVTIKDSQRPRSTALAGYLAAKLLPQSLKQYLLAEGYNEFIECIFRNLSAQSNPKDFAVQQILAKVNRQYSCFGN